MKIRCSVVLFVLPAAAVARAPALWAAPMGVSRSEEVIATPPPESGADELPSATGPVGLGGMSTAEAGAPGQRRVALTGQYFNARNLMVEGDRNLRLMGALAVGFTPRRFFELFTSVSSSANRNQRNGEAGRRDPELIKSYGDLSLGGKVAAPVSRGVSAGGEVGLRLLSSVSAVAFDPRATSLW